MPAVPFTPSPRRILIADHHTERLPDVEPGLAALGHTVLRTGDALATLEAIRERRPDLILLAPLSANPAGAEVRRVLDLKDRSRQTPLILVLDEPLEGGSLRGAAERVDDVLVRGESRPAELLARVTLALGRLDRLRRIEDERHSLERQSITDFKTGTFNDRYFHRRLREEVSRARRHHVALSCVMLDFDNFKEVNDHFDHAFGDFVLLAFAKKVRAVIRDIDIPARLGGDEFALLLPSTGLDDAVTIAERIRHIVSTYLFERNGASTSISLSIGIATFDGMDEQSPEELLRQADQALLEAKRRGRNRVVLYPQLVEREPRARAADAASES